jgi:hypothetical protein
MYVCTRYMLIKHTHHHFSHITHAASHTCTSSRCTSHPCTLRTHTSCKRALLQWLLANSSLEHATIAIHEKDGGSWEKDSLQRTRPTKPVISVAALASGQSFGRTLQNLHTLTCTVIARTHARTHTHRGYS